MKEWLDCMDVCSPYKYGSDIELERLSFINQKLFLSTSEYQYHIIRGESETRPISEIAIIIVSLKFIGFSRLAALVGFLAVRRSSRSNLCCLPHFAPTVSRKKRAAEKFFPLWAQCETQELIENYAHDYACKFHQEANRSKLFQRWLAQLSECFCRQSLFAKQANFFSAVFSKDFLTRWGHFKELQVKGNLFDCSHI